MIALDTNVLARYLLADDEAQAERAAQLLESGQRLFVPVTVGLELAWVLRSEGIGKADVLDALRHVQALPGIEWQHGDAWRQALLYAAAGLDVADALHLALASQCHAVATFDMRFVAAAKRERMQPPVIAI